MKHAIATPEGLVHIAFRKNRNVDVPTAKSIRDDLSEAIHEAEGGDPIVWQPIVYERKLKDTMARVFFAVDRWRFKAWVQDGKIVEGDFAEKEEALAAADAALVPELSCHGEHFD